MRGVRSGDAHDTNEAGADGGGREGAQTTSANCARRTSPAPERAPGAAVRRSEYALRASMPLRPSMPCAQGHTRYAAATANACRARAPARI